MTFEEAEAFLGRVTCRPGWKLRLRPGWKLRLSDLHDGLDSFGSVSLVVEMEVEDAYRPGSRARIQHVRPLPPLGALRDESHLLAYLRQELGAVERHERDEWLKVDGEMPFDPHRE